MLNVWFIDDNENFMEAMKICLNINIKKDDGIFNNRINIKFIDPGIDGNHIVEIIKNASNNFKIPDLIFLDLRYPIDKRKLLETKEENAVDPMQLSGIRLLEAICENDNFNSCFPIIFSEVPLNEDNKAKIKQKFNYSSRNIKFIEKFPSLKLMELQINEVDKKIVTKNCNSLKNIIETIDKKLGV